jgi:hypothetical protein
MSVIHIAHRHPLRPGGLWAEKLPTTSSLTVRKIDPTKVDAILGNLDSAETPNGQAHRCTVAKRHRESPFTQISRASGLRNWGSP